MNFNFILPKVITDYIRQAQVLNIDNLRLNYNIQNQHYLEQRLQTNKDIKNGFPRKQ